MNFFGQLKEMINGNQKIDKIKSYFNLKQESSSVANNKNKDESESFQYIVNDILENKSNDKKYSEEFVDFEDYFEGEEDLEQQGVENMYIKDYIFIGDKCQGKELTLQEWTEIIKTQNLSLQSRKNIYFSIFKGIDFSIRKEVWQILANTKDMKLLTNKTYTQLTNQLEIPKSDIQIILKDVPRSLSITKYLPELKNILVAYVNFSKKPYTQGMNLIAGSLLTLLALENDNQLEEFQIMENQFEERVFWVFIGIMHWKNWQRVFEKDLEGLKKMLKTLEELMTEHCPEILYKIHYEFEWDLTIFSQYYITLLLYNTPKQFSKIILDLFLIDGQNILHSLIIRMMILRKEKILSLADQAEFMSYFRKDFINDCYMSVMKNKDEAKKLEDFEINFIKTSHL